MMVLSPSRAAESVVIYHVGCLFSVCTVYSNVWFCSRKQSCSLSKASPFTREERKALILNLCVSGSTQIHVGL